jgi:hypothetical protein
MANIRERLKTLGFKRISGEHPTATLVWENADWILYLGDGSRLSEQSEWRVYHKEFLGESHAQFSKQFANIESHIQNHKGATHPFSPELIKEDIYASRKAIRSAKRTIETGKGNLAEAVRTIRNHHGELYVRRLLERPGRTIEEVESLFLESFDSKDPYDANFQTWRVKGSVHLGSNPHDTESITDGITAAKEKIAHHQSQASEARAKKANLVADAHEQKVKMYKGVHDGLLSAAYKHFGGNPKAAARRAYEKKHFSESVLVSKILSDMSVINEATPALNVPHDVKRNIAYANLFRSRQAFKKADAAFRGAKSAKDRGKFQGDLEKAKKEHLSAQKDYDKLPTPVLRAEGEGAGVEPRNSWQNVLKTDSLYLEARNKERFHKENASNLFSLYESNTTQSVLDAAKTEERHAERHKQRKTALRGRALEIARFGGSEDFE